MKKGKCLIVLVIILSGLLNPIFAQDSVRVFKKGDLLVQGNFGIGGWIFQGSTVVPPVNVVIEKGITDNWSIGLIGSHASSRETSFFNPFYEDVALITEYNYWFLGPSMAIHLTSDIVEDFGIPSERMDIYSRFFLGYVFVSSHVSIENDGDPIDSSPGDELNTIGYGVYGGMTYYLNPQFGIHGELGFGNISLLRFGITLNF